MSSDLVGFLVVQAVVSWAALRGLLDGRARRRAEYVERQRLARSPIDEGGVGPDWSIE